ncbi:HPr kinase/phosphorylase [Ostreiculturibacter nitratireducens]|uniref:HPr kinase/phosphorylase n=1 Tax=Ostreiculturibacter nitratireducens TaxID=3075226 RepID=UPI003CCC87E7
MSPATAIRTTGEVLHASCVAFGPAAILILGPSGSGKSALALQLMALGCDLVSDDRTEVSIDGEAVMARAPAAIRGMIEARGIGLLAADVRDRVPVRFVVDLSQTETERLPPPRQTNVLGREMPLIHRVESAYFPAAILQYLKGGRSA